ncbi:zinc finger protein jing homolog isoform X1 [Macrosteles quadrilineatus]|uniref:zinc finger protein jing homolog isoform X1 n=2 Tax=Macrosteles quadrilineatus TaxID=74068 RepID=UPI0023E14858|nr:zinc finger protein jing homolog isoform X1 [Macrosteles quadrilineatus]
MADCALVDGLPVCKNLVVNENDVLLGSASEDSNNTEDSVKSTYFVCESDALCSKFQLNGVQLRSCPGMDGRVMGSDTEEFSSSLKSIHDENGHNCRKKRCVDRYDSSESSDSGVATLSCTDCSGSSSGTSDITEPGSPYSTVSSAESDPESPGKMPPTQSTETATAHWPCAWVDPHSPRYFQGKITEYFPAQHKKSSCDANKLAVHLSGTVVPVARLPFVFQSDKPAEPSSPVTSLFRKPSSPQVQDSVSVSDSVLPKPNTCSTPASSPADSPLSISTGETCSDKPSLPSPILRTPSIIRFPARNGWKGHMCSDVICRWTDCTESFSTTSALLEHLQAKHVLTQTLCVSFKCLWSGCKVYDKASCSASWLGRHVLSHGGNKPFPCIVTGCGQRFSSQIMLERHVNQHFNQSEQSSSSGSSSKRSLESTPNKLFRRNGKKLRYRRQPYSARMFDYIDTGMMEGVQHSLLNISKYLSFGNVEDTAANSVTLHSKIIAKRTSMDGTPSVLLRWFPLNFVRDEWVPESKVRQTQQVSWSKCEEPQAWMQPPLFHPRPGHNKRKHTSGPAKR